MEEIQSIKKEIKGKKKTTNQSENDKKELNKFELASIQKKLEEIEEMEMKHLFQKNKIIILERKLADSTNCYFSLPHLDNDQKPWPYIEDRYQVLAFMCKGTNTEIYKAFDVESLEYVALKVNLNNSRGETSAKESFTRQIRKEQEVLQHINHPNIVKFIDHFQVNGLLCTVLEHFEGQDLDTYLKLHGKISEKTVRILIRQLLLAVRHLSSMNRKVIHYDIQPQNIMVNETKIVKLVDFGLCKVIEEENELTELTSQDIGTYWNLPPECFEPATYDKPVYISSKVDIWSIGVVCYQMLYGRKPFYHGMPNEKIQKEKTILKTSHLIFPETPSVSNELKDFMKKCMNYDVESRFEISKAIQVFPKIP